MLKVGVPKVLVSFVTIFGVSNMLYGFNKSVLCATFNLLSAAFDGKVVEEVVVEEVVVEEEEKEEAGKAD